MQDNIVTEPKPARRISTPLELSYFLQVDDYVAYWVYLSRAARLPKRVHKAMRDTVGVSGGLTWMAGLLLSGVLIALYPPVGIPCAIVTMCGFGCGMVFALSRIDHKPSTCFQGWVSKPYRWLCLWGLRHLARSDAQEGILDTESRYRFTMNAEGFTLTTEHAASVEPSATREDRVPWTALEDAAYNEGHAFLIVRKGVVAIIPRRCFAAPADFDSFAALVFCYRANVGVERSSTAICALEDRLLASASR